MIYVLLVSMDVLSVSAYRLFPYSNLASLGTLFFQKISIFPRKNRLIFFGKMKIT